MTSTPGQCSAVRPRHPTSPVRDELIAETEALWVVGAFGEAESLCNKYANPALDDLSDEDLRATLHQAATEWESELDESIPIR